MGREEHPGHHLDRPDLRGLLVGLVHQAYLLAYLRQNIVKNIVPTGAHFPVAFSVGAERVSSQVVPATIQAGPGDGSPGLGVGGQVVADGSGDAGVVTGVGP